MKRHLITSALPYINGIKHLGNLIGSILPADVYARHLRQQGETVLYICGTDEHGTPAELAAEKAGKPVEIYCKEMYETQKKIYEAFHIQFDYFGRTSSPANHKITQEIFLALEKNGYIREREIQQIYSLDDQRFLPDRYVEGTCPKCGFNKARGDQCDQCGSLLDPTDLIDPYSAVSGSKRLEVRSTQHLFLELSALEPEIRAWIDAHPEWPAVTKGIAHKWLQEGLKERCISRDLQWGVKIPKAGFENKVFYVWFDAPMGYISMTQEWAEKHGENWESWWKTDAENKAHKARLTPPVTPVEYVQFMAKDNVPFHAIFWPAMLIGSKQNWKLADEIKSFSWLTYAGGKFSTSNHRGIFTDDALKLFPPDYWRYYLLANAPEASDSDFTFEHFAATINKDLADILGNFVNRVMALIEKYFYGCIPPAENFPNDLREACTHLISAYDTALREFKFRQAAQYLRALWVLGNEYITAQQPWKLVKINKDAAGAVLHHCLMLIQIYAVVGQAMMPETSGKLAGILSGMDSRFRGNDMVAVMPAHAGIQSFQEILKFELLPIGQKIHPIKNLFAKIDDEMVEKLAAEYAGQS